MKSLFKFLLFLTLLSLSLSVRLQTGKDRHSRHKREPVPVDGTCDEDQSRRICDKGLECVKLAFFFAKTNNLMVDWKCKAEDYKIPVGEPCIYQLFGSQCIRNDATYATCEGVRAYPNSKGRKTKIGTCRLKGENKNLPPHLLRRARSIKTTPMFNLPDSNKLDEDENQKVDDCFEDVVRDLPNKDAFTAGYLILQYFVDEDEIKNETLKSKTLKELLGDMRTQGRKCEDIEEQLNFHGGIHVVNTWTTEERNKYDWMVNNNYIKGLQGAYDKALNIRAVADATGNSASRVVGQFASNAEIAGGFIKTLVDLAVQTVVNKQLTNAMLASTSATPSKGDGRSDKRAVALFYKHGDRFDFGDGFGLIPGNSICNELRIDAGLKYMTGVKQA